MNFTGIPELSWKYSYPTVIVVSLSIVLISLWICKKKNFGRGRSFPALPAHLRRRMPLAPFYNYSYFISAKSCAARNHPNNSSSICPISDIIMWCVQRPGYGSTANAMRGESSRCERPNDTIINTSGQPFIRRSDTKAKPYRALKVICDCCTFNIASGHSA